MCAFRNPLSGGKIVTQCAVKIVRMIATEDLIMEPTLLARLILVVMFVAAAILIPMSPIAQYPVFSIRRSH
jgi:hypothetical protein